MSEEKFTKGWWAPREQTGERWYVDSEHGNICIVSYPDDGDDAANARLIAASPDTYAVCAALDAEWTDWHPAGPDDPALQEGPMKISDRTLTIWRACRAALSRVHGEAEEEHTEG